MVRIQNRGGGFLPQIAMAGQLQIEKAECGQKRGMVRSKKLRVRPQVRIVGRQALRVVICSDRGRAFGVLDKRDLQFVRNHAKFVPAHMQQGIHAGFDPDRVGRGDKFAIGHKSSLMGAGDNPLGIGGGNVVTEPQNLSTETRGFSDLPSGVVRI